MSPPTDRRGLNLKLDKTGALTEALCLHDSALAEGYQAMMGCMVGPPLTMDPATLVA